MLTTLRNAFKIPELRKKLLYTAMMLVVIRFGSLLPIPGVDKTFIQMWFAQLATTGDAFNFLDALTGGSFTNMSIFALSITPYITSSIIMQLLTIAIPKLEEMQKDGEDGRKEDCRVYPLRDRSAGADSIQRHGHRLRPPGPADHIQFLEHHRCDRRYDGGQRPAHVDR